MDGPPLPRTLAATFSADEAPGVAPDVFTVTGVDQYGSPVTVSVLAGEALPIMQEITSITLPGKVGRVSITGTIAPPSVDLATGSDLDALATIFGVSRFDTDGAPRPDDAMRSPILAAAGARAVVSWMIARARAGRGAAPPR